MSYISIDIETTGLDPEYCQVLEVGAIVDDFVTPVCELPYFHAYLHNDRFTGQPRALAMNARILDIIAEKTHKDIVYGERNLSKAFARFVEPYKQGRQVVAGGKNFGNFDREFLRRLQGWPQDIFFRRIIDPGMLYFDPLKDTVPPGTDECCRRAGLECRTNHEAMEDALIVVKLVRKHYGIPF